MFSVVSVLSIGIMVVVLCISKFLVIFIFSVFVGKLVLVR